MVEEENPFFNRYRTRDQDDDDEEISEETIKEAQQDPRFGKFMEKGTLVDESNDKDILQWLCKDKDESKEEASNVKLLTDQYGNGFEIMQKMGYDGKGPIGKIKEGIVEPIQPTSSNTREKTGLGYNKKMKEEVTQNLYEQIHRLQGSSKTDSNEWEWDSPFEWPFEDKYIDVIQTYGLVLY
ncbi:uncharacterized protein LOC131876522 [Cryptomeria japonica]|uniref:uncharacterized protein LOC131876522 n=1 Tax=Cryptomeria japonica TaxID=3369 RepID=UPI0027DAAABD|nr:uncharacterized protein LOC131876522 [Cryptomeria japonica]